MDDIGTVDARAYRIRLTVSSAKNLEKIRVKVRAAFCERREILRCAQNDTGEVSALRSVGRVTGWNHRRLVSHRLRDRLPSFARCPGSRSGALEARQFEAPTAAPHALKGRLLAELKT